MHFLIAVVLGKFKSILESSIDVKQFRSILEPSIDVKMFFRLIFESSTTLNSPSTTVTQTKCERVKEHLGYRLRTLKWRKMKLKTKCCRLRILLTIRNLFQDH